MASQPHPVKKLQLLLQETCRSEEARTRARLAVQNAGMAVSCEGYATLSARMSEEAFNALFPTHCRMADDLPVPDSLRSFIVSISVAPEHLSFR